MQTADAKQVPRRNGLVLALGSGGAAGLAHIGVLQVLAEHDIPVRAIAGTSIGAEIGAFAASGMAIADLSKIAAAFDWKLTLKLFMPDLSSGGLISGDSILEFLEEQLGDRRIEDLDMGYVAIATDLDSGEQVVIDRDRLVDAVRASISVPGLIAPYTHGKRNFTDGGVVNPLPFDVARDRFGGPVVAVSVHGGKRRQQLPGLAVQWPTRMRQLLDQSWMAHLPGMRSWLVQKLKNHEDPDGNGMPWSARHVLDRAVNITEDELVRLRAEIRPPDLVITPDVNEVGLIEFNRAPQAIRAGRAAAEAQLPALRRLAAPVREKG